MNLQYRKKAIREFAELIKKADYEVYIAESGEHGFFTNQERVVSFQMNCSSISLSGNYKASMKCGSGWRIAEFASDLGSSGKEIAEKALSANCKWANKNPTFTTKEQYLLKYQRGSKFQQI